MLKTCSTSAGHCLFTQKVRSGFVVFPVTLFNDLGFMVLIDYVISSKGNFSMIGDDLVNSYHLLLCCLDLIFANAVLCPYKKDLLNPSFRGMFLTYLQNINFPYDF